ncbi:metalloregulator ArsR/SmtB family transcription factor [Paenibacillus sp. D2_2]|uniref:ArsR/SmtB family transcription factor n=1 Tax=Paenibacillus sp. D2_2 TaxID=3073092 RepID=UPI002816675A|nr:metalloregulator ArsR/SmtB family transcription factor [Paenibacillus sp. D2_2]WMT38965.1 metalloregulator ArsR/SmtB family transcription factor [Paenibacillus sp. D2_2]
MEDIEELDKIAEEFQECQEVLTAIGDRTRQSIIIALMATRCEEGMRVGEITQRTHLSRPAVSHHLKILKDAKVVNLHSKGTKNYYYLDPNQSKIMLLKNLVEHIEEFMTDYWPSQSKN